MKRKLILQPYTSFYGKWIDDCIITVKEINEDKNLLIVVIKPKDIHRTLWEEQWNLQHTMWGFSEGDYYFKQLCSEFEVRDCLGGEVTGNYELDLEIMRRFGYECGELVYAIAHMNTEMP